MFGFMYGSIALPIDDCVAIVSDAYIYMLVSDSATPLFSLLYSRGYFTTPVLHLSTYDIVNRLPLTRLRTRILDYPIAL